MAGMLSLRLADVAQTPNGPLLGDAGHESRRRCARCAVTSLAASCENGAVEAGLERAGGRAGAPR